MSFDSRLKLAGYLCFFLAVVGIPATVLCWYLNLQSGPTAALIRTLIQLIFMPINVFIYLSLGKLLKDGLDFDDASWIIKALIVLAIGAVLFGIVAPSGKGPWSLVLIGALIAEGILSIVLGVLILRLRGRFFGLGRPYAYVTILAGIGEASVVLAPFTVVIGVIGSVILGMIFLRATDQKFAVYEEQE